MLPLGINILVLPWWATVSVSFARLKDSNLKKLCMFAVLMLSSGFPGYHSRDIM
jgi:hypothetical protein